MEAISDSCQSPVPPTLFLSNWKGKEIKPPVKKTRLNGIRKIRTDTPLSPPLSSHPSYFFSFPFIKYIVYYKMTSFFGLYLWERMHYKLWCTQEGDWVVVWYPGVDQKWARSGWFDPPFLIIRCRRVGEKDMDGYRYTILQIYIFKERDC